MGKIVAKQFISSTKIRPNKHRKGAVVVKEKLIYDDGEVKNNLSVIVDPKRKFYIVKPGLRDLFNIRTTSKPLEQLDEYICHDSELASEIFKALHGFHSKRVSHYDMVTNPNVFGATIDIETLIAKKYQTDFDKSGVKPVKLQTGNFDIEASIVHGEVICATLTHEHKVYTGVLRKYMYTHVKENGVEVKIPISDIDIELLALKTFDNLMVTPKGKASRSVNSYGFEYDVQSFNTEVELLAWLFKKANDNGTDLIGIWNAKYDISKIYEVCNRAGVSVTDVLCPESLPAEYRYARFKEDTNKKLPHFTRAWDYLYLTSQYQFFDAMQLYSRLRIVDGFEASYKLDAILKNVIGVGKLKFPHLIDPEKTSDTMWHTVMQEKYMLEYVVYNIADVVLLQIMHWVTQDPIGMKVLTGNTSFANFNKQSKRALDVLYFKFLERGKVVGAGKPKDKEKTNDDDDDNDGSEEDALENILKVGGAVLNLRNTRDIGIAAIKDMPYFVTGVLIYMFDIDLSSVYPFTTIACNISDETLRSSIISIDGRSQRDTEIFTCGYILSNTDAVNIANEFFNLPHYTDMVSAFEREFTPNV